MSTSPTARDVILRDGSTLRLRAPTAADEDRILSFLSQLSPESRYLRFHGFPHLGPKLIAPVLDPDWSERGSLVGELDGRIVALTSYVRLRDATAAEAAFTVEDALQGRGVGTRLLEQLAAQAAAAGIERFVAQVLPENRRMLNVFQEAGFEVSRRLDGGEVEVSFSIKPTERFRERVAERDHLAVTASLRPFFLPRSVAVIGASPRRGSIGGELFRNVLAGDFVGSTHPINRTGEPVAGVAAYSSMSELPEPVELAVICVPASEVLGAAEDALRAGVRALCVISAGFAETGPEGAERQDRLLALVRSRGARLVGPNCLGISSATVKLNATFASRAFPPGSIGFSSQSGALGLALLERAEARGLGFSAFVSIGNKADVSANDLLEWWEDDEATRLVLLYVESFGNPRKFGRIARRLARTKPILAMKSGTSRAGRRAATSHTAALAGSEAAVDALFRQAGVIRAQTLVELVDIAALLSSQPLPAGDRVAVVTNAGGLGILCADACEAVGLQLPELAEETQAQLRDVLPPEASVRNPVDVLGSAHAASYEAALPLVHADPSVDAVIVLFVPPVAVDEAAVGAAITASAASAPEKPVLCSFLSAHGPPATLGVPSFPYPEAAAKALGRAAERGTWLRRPVGSVPQLDVDRATGAAVVADSRERWLESDEARRLLQAYGIPLVEERSAADPQEAVAAAEGIGFPVVVKTAEAGAHKTETGGVVLDLEDEVAVWEAATRIGGPVLVQRQVRGLAELLAGIVQDPTFGPLVAFGPGGVLAELIGGAGFRLAPLTDVDARELVHGGTAGQLVAGFRGRLPADEEALVELLLRLSRLAEDLPEVAELDLNPVLALRQGYVTVDARMRVARPAPRRDTKTW